MAEHVWIVPVSCGRGVGPTTVVPPLHPKDFNVQWDFQVYPTQIPQVTELACIDWTSVTQFAFPPLQMEARLNACFTRWWWRSCTDGVNVLTGGQLMVGTVFSRLLKRWIATPLPPGPPPDFIPDPAGPLVWDTVEAWVKYRVSAVGPLAAIYFGLSDTNPANYWYLGTPPNHDWLTVTAPNVWQVAYVKKVDFWEDPVWANENLRATVHFLGTNLAANVGRVDVDIEWFAFRLSQS